jgi:CRISPR-associated protein Cmx8
MDIGRFYYLLQFWPLVTQVYVPTKIKAKPGEQPNKREDAGFALAIPDITDLALFVDEFPEMMRRRNDKAGGFYPEQCRIDIPAEAAHETLVPAAERNRIPYRRAGAD